MLSFIPDAWLLWAVHGITIAGAIGLVAAFFLTKIPFVKNYGLMLKGISTLLFIVGVFFEGGYATEKSWRDRSAAMQQQVKESEEAAKKNNERIKTQIVTKIEYIKQNQIVVQEKIKEVEKIVDAKCELAPEAIEILNSAAKEPGSAK